MEMTLHVTINQIPDSYFTDEQYDNTHDNVIAKIMEIVEGVEGSLYDIEIK
jgi:hypothetical protein